MEAIICEIERLLERKPRVIVAIEGPCASGKTTLAKALSASLGATVFHADDFFLRPSQRTEERLLEVGGNLDRERFFEEVISKLSSVDELTYRPYDCHRRMLSDGVTESLGRVVIVEGSYCMHPDLDEAYDQRIFIDISEEKQRERIEKRNPQMQKRFFEEWIPMERRYFAQMGIREKCQIQIMA